MIQVYLKKIETFQINDLTIHLQKLEEKQETKPRANRRNAISKIYQNQMVLSFGPFFFFCLGESVTLRGGDLGVHRGWVMLVAAQ